MEWTYNGQQLGSDFALKVGVDVRSVWPNACTRGRREEKTRNGGVPERAEGEEEEVFLLIPS